MHGHIYVHGGMIGFDCVFVSSPAKVSAFICGTRYNMVTVAERKAHQPAQLLFKGVVIQTSDIFSVCLNMFSVASVFLDFFLAPESNPSPHEGKSFSLFFPQIARFQHMFFSVPPFFLASTSTRCPLAYYTWPFKQRNWTGG